MERLILTHVKVGDRERFDYRVGYLVDRPHSVVAELEALDVSVTKLSHRSGERVGWLRVLHEYLRDQRIDILHVHSPLPAALSRILVQTLDRRTALVYTEHNRWGRYSLPTRMANRATFWMDDAHFAVSEECRSSVDRIQRESVGVLIHGIDVNKVRAQRTHRAEARRELGVGDDQFLVGTVANLRAQKNYPLLLEVAARVRQRRPQVVFVAAGQGPLQAELYAIKGRLGLGDGFRFLGFRPDVIRVMAAFDVLCFSSDHEGLPVALMEGRALGLPVVATAAGGLAHHVADGRDGLLVPRGDAPALTGALLSLVDEPSLGARLAASSAERADEYRAQDFVLTLERRYCQIARHGW